MNIRKMLKKTIAEKIGAIRLIIFLTSLLLLLFSSFGCSNPLWQDRSNTPDLNRVRDLLNPSHTAYPQSSFLPDYITDEMLSRAQKCQSPVYPEFSIVIDPYQRYGCFCGIEYPASKLFPAQNYESLSTSERKALIEELYQTLPLDQIDAACLRHDACVVLAGKQTIECNEAFVDDMFYLKSLFYNDDQEISKRCFTLASDSGVAFLTPVPVGASENKYDEYTDKFARLVSTGTAGLLYFGARTLSLLYIEYPLAGEKCFVNGNKLAEK